MIESRATDWTPLIAAVVLAVAAVASLVGGRLGVDVPFPGALALFELLWAVWLCAGTRAHLRWGDDAVQGVRGAPESLPYQEIAAWQVTRTRVLGVFPRPGFDPTISLVLRLKDTGAARPVLPRLGFRRCGLELPIDPVKAQAVTGLLTSRVGASQQLV